MDRYAACFSSTNTNFASIVSSYYKWFMLLVRRWLDGGVAGNNDSTLVDSNVQQLLGQGSIATTKSPHDRCLEFLGWDFNLDTRTITLCARNTNKLVHALFSFHPTDKISISHIQRLASLISRVSILSRHMRPYAHTLHSITSGYVYTAKKLVRLGLKTAAVLRLL